MATSTAPLPPPAPRSPTTWTDLSQHWHWPKLLKAIPLALGPSRLVLALLVCLVFVGLDRLYVAIWDTGTGVGTGPFGTISAFIAGSVEVILNGVTWRGLNATVVADEINKLFITGPWAFLSAKGTWWLVFIVPVFLTIFSLLAGAIARSAACEFAGDVRISMGQSVSFAFRHCVSLFFAYAAPILVIWIMCLAMAGVGWLMFHASVPAMIFSIFYFVFLLFALVVALIAIAYFVGAIMLAPAIACEGTDAYDAVQRAYAYVFSKPFKLIFYAFIIIIAGVIATSLVVMVCRLVVNLAVTLSGATSHTEIVAETGKASWARRSSLWIVGFWNDIVASVVMAFVITYTLCAGTILYLLMRKAADGQEVEEIWMPGMVPGTAASAAPAPVTAPIAPPGGASGGASKA